LQEIPTPSNGKAIGNKRIEVEAESVKVELKAEGEGNQA